MITTKQFGMPGSNPFLLDGPAVALSGVPLPQFAPGSVAYGDYEAEFVYCKLVLNGSTTLKDGQAYVVDRDYSATLLTTANSPRGNSVAIGRVVAPVAPAAATYYLWLQRAGHCPIQATGSGNALGETTATGGLVNFNNSPTATSKAVLGLTLFGTNYTFVADTTNGSPILTNVSDTSNLAVGATVTGTGVAGLLVTSINKDGTVTLSGNASATGAAITMTVTGVLPGNLLWPYIDKTN